MVCSVIRLNLLIVLVYMVPLDSKSKKTKLMLYVELCTYIFPNEPREVCYFIQEKKIMSDVK